MIRLKRSSYMVENVPGGGVIKRDKPRGPELGAASHPPNVAASYIYHITTVCKCTNLLVSHSMFVFDN